MATLTARNGLDMGTADPEEQALVRAILVQPADDTARLIYADWLEERGEVERSEFIRLQCGMPTEWSVSRERELLEHFAAEDMAQRFGLRPHETLYAVDSGYTVPGAGVELEFGRGFVSRIECTLAQFMGEMCIGCGGTRTEYYDGAMHTCVICHGTGQRPGLVDTLFRVQPVTEVVLTDIRPAEFVAQPPYRNTDFYFIRRDVGVPEVQEAEHALPLLLWNELIGHDETPSPRVHAKRYPTREAAIAALSRACVALGRKRAGLPPI